MRLQASATDDDDGSLGSPLSSLATDTDIAMPSEVERARIQQCMVAHLPSENETRVLALGGPSQLVSG